MEKKVTLSQVNNKYGSAFKIKTIITIFVK